MRLPSPFHGLIFLAVGLGFGSHADAQQLMFESLTVNDGLSMNHVSAIAQDASGFLWFGTGGGGLNRFDGYDFRVFRHRSDDPTSLSSNTIRALHVDASGRLWVGTEQGLDRFEPDSETFTRYQYDPIGATSLGPGSVGSIASDARGQIWVATNDLLNRNDHPGSVARLDPGTGSIDRFQAGGHLNDTVSSVFIDSSGTVWAGVGSIEAHREPAGRGLYRFDSSSGRFVRVPLGSDTSDDPGIMEIAEDGAGNLWLATWGRGIALLERDRDEPRWFSMVLGDPRSLAGNHVLHLLMDSRGKVWAITWGGPSDSVEGNLPGALNVIDPESGTTVRFGRDPSNPYAFGEFPLRSLFADSFGTVWVGTSGGGLRYADFLSPGFSIWDHNPRDADSLSSNFVRAVLVESEDRLWVGTSRGLDLVNRRTGTIRHWVHAPENSASLGPGRVEALYRDRQGNLWIGTLGGLHRYDERTNTFSHYRHDPSDPRSLSNNFVMTINEARDGKLLIGTEGGGLNLFEPDTGRFSRFPFLLQDTDGTEPRRISAVEQTDDGLWWIGSGGGLFQLDRRFATSENHMHDPGNANSISSNAVSAIHVDRKRDGVLWVGTWDEGLNRFDRASGTWQRYDLIAHGVPDNLVYAIQDDELGALWMSTNHGLLRFDPDTLESRIYGIDRGIQAPEFNHRAAARGADGELFFGGVHGLNAFFPERIVDSTVPPRVVVTGVEFLNRDSSSSGSSYQEIYRTGMPSAIVSLTHRQRDLVFDYVALHSTHPDKHLYQIKLEGFERDWRDMGTSRRAVFTNLDTGDYRFAVRAANSHGVWSETAAYFEFSVQPPFWDTWLFRILMAAGFLAAGVAFFRWRVSALRRRERQLEVRVDKRTAELQDALSTIEAQARRLGELDEAKSRFFANVSHEFRTPLTLTLGPLQDLRDGFYGKLPEEAGEDLDIAIRNARRLLRLVNQLMDMAKLEAGQLQPRFRKIDLQKLLGDVVLSFAPLAERRRITTKTGFGEATVAVWVDPEMVEQVFTNLLSNAFKFTPEGGTVQVRLCEHPFRGTVVVEVQDSGAGIPPDLVPHIFDRFFQASETTSVYQVGTGLGLALTKELVELHHGEIEARSVQGLGTTLIVSLKTGRDHLADHEVEAEPAEARAPTGPAVPTVGEVAGGSEQEQTEDDDATTVLVIDDSSEIRQFVRKHLEANYRVIEAEDGAEGLDLVRSELPDVVISDIIMPRLDGVELCRTIKSEPELEFVPVILLTAKASIDSRVEGLESGADDYLTKPFEVRELQARVSNLIESRRRLMERLGEPGQTPPLGILPPAETVRESEFSERVRMTITAKIADVDFGVEALADELDMSRVHLYRRMREELDKQPSELIMTMRLERAAQLLSANACSVAEVAYGVGFKSVSHFTKRFRQRFEQTPSAFRSDQTTRI